MRNLALVVLVLSLTACASIPKKLLRVSPGMSKQEVGAIMGEPDDFRVDGSREVYAFDSRSERYVVVFEEGKVTKYGPMDAVFPPSEEELARRAQIQAARAQAAAMYMQMQQREPSYQPVTIYQPARTTQTNCQMSGNQVNCSSQPSGLDTSIYQNIGR